MPVDFQIPQIPLPIRGILSTVGPLDVVDILIVAIILYKIYEMLQDTRAITLVKGLLVLLGVTLVCNAFELHVISWLLQKAVTLIFVALPIVFQPELRRGLEHLGQGRRVPWCMSSRGLCARCPRQRRGRCSSSNARWDSTTSVRQEFRSMAL